MEVQKIMSAKPISISGEESAAVAARLLSRHNIGALPVCSREGKLRGIVTDRDIVLRCIAPGEDPKHTPVSDIMTRRLVWVDSRDSCDTAARLMASRQIRRLPVQENGRLVGMVSLGDLAKLRDFSTEAAEALSEISENIRNL
ncbi:MAG: CBS domain-containing protein [Oscillospiraceae bacterium]|nr:CBS domain-containing protein [Oscillospiraceae bacterium]